MADGATTPPDLAPHMGAWELARDLPLSADEAAHVEAARAPNTLRAYRSTGPSSPAGALDDGRSYAGDGVAISAYPTELARAGVKLSTMSRRLSAIKFAHQLRDWLTRPQAPGS